MLNVEPVVFENRNGLKLFGIVHQPATKVRRDIGIILLSPGVKTRVAPHRLYRKMAERFSRSGYLVLRFDFYGLGDAEGEIEDYYLADFYGTVAVGRYIEDSLVALDWLQQEYGLNKVVFAGLCGGALTGLLAGADDKRVIGLLGLGLPVVLDSNNVNKSQYVTQGQLNQLKTGYLKKIFNPKAWLRLFTFKSDFKVIAKVLGQMVSGSRKKEKKPAQASSGNTGKEAAAGDFNDLFPPAFFKMTNSGRKILLIYSGADRLAWEFEEKFVPNYQKELNECRGAYEIHTIKSANHILSDKQWFEEMMEYSKTWINRSF